ncbi:MAG TPA: DUF3488 and transglutaminase-like domain-containing protein [Acidimicrobiales bacterium]|nr:DUF3488 and transglutaminase-like domain-containing protein [Acidimicrobiales bacterium]
MSRRRNDRLLLAGEASLALLTIAAIIGMHRLFRDSSYRGPLVAQALVASAAAALLRRAGVRVLPAALACVGLAVAFITWTRFPDTARWLLPTGDTLRAVGDDVSEAWRTFGDVRAPAPVHNGFVAVSAAAVWAIVFVADWAAFRVWATFEALLPATTLFVFSAALGGPGSPVAGAALFAGAALLVVLVHRTANQERTSRWAGDHRSHGRSSLLATGAALLGVAVVVGTAAGPRLPGAGAEAVVAWRDLTKDDPTRVVPSPMVSLNTRLVEQSEAQVFTVKSEEAAYWRLTALDEFDGNIWRSSYGTETAKGRLRRSLEPGTETRAVTQTITINALSSVWLPAAFDPTSVKSVGPDADDQEIAWDPASSTLMVDRDVETSNGYTYEVTSELPRWSKQELRNASPRVPDDIAATFTALPQTFPDEARAWAADVTRGAGTPYDKALALQDTLRTFTYDKTVAPGHSNDALLTFLLETQRGYCEQFAGAFAALARSVGLPARVAIGFTPGQKDPYDRTLYTVKGVHAHAWPEVYLGEYGWVPFEPTPTRGPPGGEEWLGIPEAQESSVGDGTAAAVPDPGQGQTGEIGASGDEQRAPGEGLGTEIGGGAEADEPGGDDSWLPEPLQAAPKVLGAGALAYVLLVPAALGARGILRRRRATTPAGRVRYWWRNVAERAAAAGIALSPSLTVAESADRLAAALPESGPYVQDLARTMERIAYAEMPASDDDAARAEEDNSRIVAETRRRVPLSRRLLAWFDARRLFPSGGGRLVAHQGPAEIRH